MDFRPLQLTDKKTIEQYTKPWKFESSDISFVNLFLWRHSYHMAWCIQDDVLYLRAHHKDFLPFAYPPIPRDHNADFCALVDRLSQDFRDKGQMFLLRGVVRPLMDKLNACCTGRMVFRPDPSAFDYVYDAQSLINLGGKKLHAKRNHINRFQKEYPDHRLEALTSAHVPECIEVYENWLSRQDEDTGRVMEEKQPVLEALRYMEQLGLVGAVVRVNGNIEAFTLGERLHADTGLIHIEKANREIRGLYTYINQAFAKMAFSDVLYINREEDMGLPGLRKAKQSYYPIKLVEKFVGTLPEET